MRDGGTVQGRRSLTGFRTGLEPNSESIQLRVFVTDQYRRIHPSRNTLFGAIVVTDERWGDASISSRVSTRYPWVPANPPRTQTIIYYGNPEPLTLIFADV